MLKAKVSEIFRSIQGEGKYAGADQVFVRFYGCNMRCTWCDTPDSIGNIQGIFQEYTFDELTDCVVGLSQGIHSVSITGGEPLAQGDFIKEFLPKIKKAGLSTYLETNGIFYELLKEIISDVDIVAMDMKLPSSTGCRPYWREHKEFLKVVARSDVFVKAVISPDTTKEDLIKSAEIVSEINPYITFILQPEHSGSQDGAVMKCLDFQSDCSKLLRDVRVLPQMHKIMNMR